MTCGASNVSFGMPGRHELTVRAIDRESRMAAAINSALKRVEDGTYGVCEECGGPIGVERLKARPVTTLCIQCKSEQEEREKHA